MAQLMQIVTSWRDPVSWAIRFSCRSWASHAEFVSSETGATFGARWNGVKIRPYRQDEHTHVQRYTFDGIEDAYKWALTQAGKKYDYSAITGIALDRDWRNPNRWFCSELVARSAEVAGNPLLNPSEVVWRITPRDLLLSTRLTRVS